MDDFHPNVAAPAFTGGLLARQAERRGQAGAILGDPRARVLPLWRGRVLMAQENAAGAPLSGGGDAPAAGGRIMLAGVAPGHAVLAEAREAPVFLGADAMGAPWFAQDISDWTPEGALPDMTAFFDPTAVQHPALPPHWAFGELRGAMLALSPLEAEIAATARAILHWHESHRFCARCGQPSAPVEGGWQRRCPACNAGHFPRTDPVVIMLVTQGNAALLGRSPAWPEGMYSCLAGFMEPGETMEAAVAREVMEETGVQVGAVRYVTSQPWPFPASLMLGCRAEALDRALTLDPVEIEDALWVSREELTEVFAGTHPRIRPPRKGAIAEYLMRQWLADRL
ncbi:NAD(+) diphosphatase [Phaeovulum sp. W22_SRMD_FR3]|uniref:NAD(+) diphosphatase n=1 Tax=Phaeovulum sp. W22_SRMD_FR3 TaxID=3240274 RepID=UPI003F95B68C